MSKVVRKELKLSRVSVFDSPFLLGFDHFERVLDRVSKSSAEGYPPYNIEQIGDNSLRITLAVAGFSLSDLSVTIEDNELVIRGGKKEEEVEKVFIHRGIASRQFQRSFVLAEEIDINSATLDNGLLNIDLERILPEPDIRTIKIKDGKEKKNNEKAKIINMNTE